MTRWVIFLGRASFVSSVSQIFTTSLLSLFAFARPPEKSRLKSNFPLKMQKHDGARAPHSSSRPSMLTALRIDARATDIHSSAMTIHTYASPSAKPREGDDGGDDSGARRQCAKFTIWNDFGDKENVDPVTATAATTRRRSKDCTPSRPPLADITRRFTPPVRRSKRPTR